MRSRALQRSICTAAVLAAGSLTPGRAEPPFINMLFPPPGFVGPRDDPAFPHDLPSLPLHATQCQEGGTAKVTLTITAAGSVSDVAVVESTGVADLDAVTVVQLGKWRYLPATKDGTPIAVRISVKVPFIAEKHGPNFAADCTGRGTQAAADAVWAAQRSSSRASGP